MEVRRHEPMVARKRNLGLVGLRPRVGRPPRRERRELEGPRPALGPVEQILADLAGELRARRAQEQLCLPAREREIGRPELQQAAAHPQPCGDRALDPARDDDCRALGDVLGEQRHDLDRVRLAEHVSVFDDEHALLRGSERGGEARHHRAPEGRLRGGERVERPAIDGRQPVDRRGEVPQQHDRVVVAPIECDPGESSLVASSPLREQGRLPVAARGDDGNGSRAEIGAQAIDERRARDSACRSCRRPELRLHDIEWKGVGCGLDQDGSGACSALGRADLVHGDSCG